MLPLQTINQAMVDLLLKAGADVNAKNSAGYTPLMLVVRAGHAKVVVRLLAEQKLRTSSLSPQKSINMLWIDEELHTVDASRLVH